MITNEKCVCETDIKEGEELLRYFNGAEHLVKRKLCDYCYAEIGVYPPID